MSRFHVRPFSIRITLLALALFIMPALAGADQTVKEALGEGAKFLPDQIGTFHADAPAGLLKDSIFKNTGVDASGTISASRSYVDDANASFLVKVVRTENDSMAFALLTQMGPHDGFKLGGIGTANIVVPGRITFYKGANLVQLEWIKPPAAGQEQLISIAKALAATLPEDDDDIPVLVKHLPDWQTMAPRARYAVTPAALKGLVLNEPVLDALSFDGGTEAVTANYGQSQLVIVEFTTPQLSIDNDDRVWTKIKELKSQGQPAPTAYRRVGNYSVFVFDAPDEKTANDLVDQVKYEQVVQWLGDDPHMADRLQRYFSRVTSGVLVAVLKSSGLSLVFCLGLGGLIGALLFRHRRAQKAALYSDAGGATRLNLDDLTGTSNSQRLLDSGKQPEADS
jgi:hypothetical protein